MATGCLLNVENVSETRLSATVVFEISFPIRESGKSKRKGWGYCIYSIASPMLISPNFEYDVVEKTIEVERRRKNGLDFEDLISQR